MISDGSSPQHAMRDKPTAPRYSASVDHWRSVVKRWSIEIPEEWFLTVPQTGLPDALKGYSGTVSMQSPYDWARNTVRIYGEHDPTDADAQAAVANLVALVYPRRKMT